MLKTPIFSARVDVEALALFQAGVHAIERGETVPHEQVMTMLDGMIEQQRAKCAA